MPRVVLAARSVVSECLCVSVLCHLRKRQAKSARSRTVQKCLLASSFTQCPTQRESRKFWR